MRFRMGFVLALVVAACALPPRVAADANVTFSLDQTRQGIEGWGTSLAHWNATARNLYATDAFRNAYRDLGLNILRMDMQKEVLAATPVNGVGPLGDDLAANIAQMNFTIARVAVYGQLHQWLQANALEPDEVRLTGALWTPPHWMKGPTGNSVNGTPTPYITPGGDSVGGRLRTEDPHVLDQYGKYIAAWVRGFEQQYGATFHAISLQNESTYENPFNSMTYIVGPDGQQDFTQYATGLKAVKDAWEQFGLTTAIKGPHVATFNTNPANPYALWWQNMMIAGVKNHSDPTLIDFLDYYNANFYNGTSEGAVKNVAAFYLGGDAVAPGEWAHWHKPPGVAGDGKPIWYSETSGETGNWSSAIHVALKMHNALVHGEASAYLYWQLAEDAPNVSQYTLLGANQLNDPSQSKKYNAFKHFSRYVRPGAVRLDAVFDNGRSSLGGASPYDTANSLNVSAFHHPEDNTLTFVLINMHNAAEQVAIELPAGLTLDDLRVFRTSSTENFAAIQGVTVADGRLLYHAPALSVTTLTASIPEPTLGLLPGAMLLLRRPAP